MLRGKRNERIPCQNIRARSVKGKALCAAILGMMLCPQAKSRAYFGGNEDYLLSMQKPEMQEEGHYLEFVNEETYVVEKGDTLWEIAEEYWGDGAYCSQIAVDNKDVINDPDWIFPGMELMLRQTMYIGAGLEDYINHEVFGNEMLLDERAFAMEDFEPPYRIFVSVPYVNDLQEADPYENWEAFQEEIRRCSREICGGRVSGLAFERFQVTGVGPLCGYHFTFDAGDKEYIVMAYFCYTDSAKSEAFALCEKDSCQEEQLALAKGKALYAAVAYLDPGVYYVKTQDYVGAKDWKYPQLRNPFTDAMQSLYTGALSQEKEEKDAVILHWEDTVMEESVRECLVKLWQLSPEEEQAFRAREMTANDLSRIEKLEISYDAAYGEAEDEERFCIVMRGDEGQKAWSIVESDAASDASVSGESASGVSASGESASGVPVSGESASGVPVSGESASASAPAVPDRQLPAAGLLTTLQDVANFQALENLDISLNDCDITDLSPIGELVNLRVLTCDIYSSEVQVENVDFLKRLVNLRTLCLGGWKWGSITTFFDSVTDLSVLLQCPKLAYLTLGMGNVESYEFLGELPEMYYFRLLCADGDKKVEPDLSLLPNACFIELYGESVRFEVGVR